ncbi:MAG TPA: PAS domain S-box protein [Candidatus Brocadiaceae bacterium]|nr:PAS domain S-box protein [Candidatus Brocadiaceae bacterium]
MGNFNLSLKTKAIIGVGVVLLPIVFSFSLSYQRNKADLEKRIIDTVTVIAETHESNLYLFLEKLKQRALDFSSDGAIRKHLLRKSQGREIASDVLSKHLVENKLPLSKAIKVIHVLSPDGQVVASTNSSEIGKDCAEEDFFLKGKEGVVITDLPIGYGGTPELVVSTPIINKSTGALLGVIANFIHISELSNLLRGDYTRSLGAISWNKGKKSWKTLEIYLVNSNKRMITESLFVDDAILKQKVDTVPINVCFESQKETAGFYKNYRGVMVVGASMYIPSMKWALLVEIGKDEIFAPIYNVRQNMLITAAVVIAMVVLLFILFIRKFVNPLRMVSAAAKDIAIGNFSIALPTKSHDEIGLLCQSFNYMVRHVNERTSALMQSEARLAEAQQIAHTGNWEWDVTKNVVYWSDEVYCIFGLPKQEFGATYEAFLDAVHPSDRWMVKDAVHNALYESKPYSIEHRILRNELSPENPLKVKKTTRFVHEKAKAVFDDTGRVVRMIGTVQDITERKQTAEEVQLVEAMTVAIAASEDFHSALDIVLHKMCEFTGWIYGEAWVPCPDNNHLKYALSYHHPNEKLETFSTKSKEMTFPPGIGLPGSAWSSKRPEWRPDASDPDNFPRAQIATEYGLKAAMGIPVVANNEVVAVLCFFVRENREEDSRLISLVSSVAGQLGSVIKRKQVEDALYESEEKLKAILDNAVVVIYVKDIRGRYTFVNKQYERLFHVKREEIRGKTDYDIWSPEQADTFRANDLKIIETKIPLSFDERASHDDGLHTYISTKFPLFDHNGDVYAVAGISTDITERIETEELLRKLSCAIEQSPSIVVITDTQGDIQYVNPRFTQLTGYTLEEVMGKNPRILKSGDVSPEVYKQLWETLSAGNEWRGEFCNKKKNGELYWETACISPIKNPEGAITSYIGVAEDITRIRQEEKEKQNLIEQLYHAQKLDSIGKLAGGIAHDFNNIMTAIIGYGNLIQLDMENDSHLKPYIQKILATAEKAADLTRGLLTFSRKQVTDPKPMRLNDCIKSARGILTRLIGEDIELKTTLTDTDCVIIADSTQMDQVLINLATNARDAMPDGGTLGISTAVTEIDNAFIKTHGYGACGKYALISVSDTGTGMDEKTKAQIFEPFFTTKEVGKGTGLGLAIVYGIVTQHEGYIAVNSEPAKGTTFNIYLPIVKSAIEKTHADTASNPKYGTETILLAEDDANVRKLIKTILEWYNYTVIETEDGEDAVTKFAEKRDSIQFLLLDVVMPKKNGNEVYQEIKKMKPGIKTIFISGYTDDVVQKKIPSGVKYFSKPIVPAKLLNAIREGLDR